MRVQITAAALLATSAYAQVNSTYVAGVVAALNGAKLTSLASAIQAVANTTAGTQLLTELSSSSSSFTVFAPNNAAFAAVPKSVSANTTLVSDIINYHVGRGSLNASSFAANPNHTIVTTLLNDTSVTTLNGAIIVATAATSGNTTTVQILNQATHVTVQASTTFQNLIIHVIDQVLIPPPTVVDLATAAKLTGLTGVLKTTNLLEPITNSKTLTIFAPNNAAFAKAVTALGTQATNATLLTAILGNHVINGTAVYSTQLGSGMYTSASGQKFTFASGANGPTVTSGNATANIVQADIPIANGVVHLIDAVLANGETDAGAASSAYASATSSVANAPTASGPVGSSKPNAGTALVGSSGAFAGVAVAVAAAFVGGALLV